MGRIILNNEEYTGSSGSAPVTDVTVNGSSVVNAQGVAEVTAVQDNPTFTEASTRANIASGESFATILGKIKKWFSDLASMFVSKTGDTMSGNLTIQKAGETYCKAINSNTNVGVYLDSDSNGEHGIWSSGYYDSSYHGGGKWLVERKTDGSVKLNGTADKALQDSDGNAINSTYPKKTGGDMTGMLGLYNENNVAVNFRTSSDYYTTISYQTAGNEACVFATKNLVTSWIFVNGEDSVNNHANNRWQSLTPALQIKNNCVAIGKLIANGTTPSYALDVTGASMFTASNDTPLRIKTTTTAKCYLGFYNNSALLGYYAVGTDKLPYFEPQGSSDRRIALLDEIQIGHEMGNTAYVSNDTHYLKLCTITLGQYYEYISLLVTSSFWGNQHGSADMINIQASRGSSASETPYTIQRINLAGNGGNAGQDGGREFYYYSSGNTLIIYVYVTGGNSYGSWNVSELRLKNATIEYNFQTNVTLPSGTTSNYIRLAGGVAYAYKADDADGDEDGMRIKTNYGSSLYYDGTRLYLRARYGNDLSSVTINTSSKRYKTNIEDLPEEEAKKILDVRTVNFDFKEKRWGRDRYTYDQKGVIAEEVENIIPTAVRVTEINGEVVPDAVDYSEFIPYLIKMVQMQQKEIEELKAMIKGE